MSCPICGKEETTAGCLYCLGIVTVDELPLSPEATNWSNMHEIIKMLHRILEILENKDV